MDDLFSRGDFYTVEAGSHLMLCGRTVLGKMAKKKKKGNGITENFQLWDCQQKNGGGGCRQMVTWNLPERTRVVVVFQLLICV